MSHAFILQYHGRHESSLTSSYWYCRRTIAASLFVYSFFFLFRLLLAVHPFVLLPLLLYTVESGGVFIGSLKNARRQQHNCGVRVHNNNGGRGGTGCRHARGNNRGCLAVLDMDGGYRLLLQQPPVYIEVLVRTNVGAFRLVVQYACSYVASNNQTVPCSVKK